MVQILIIWRAIQGNAQPYIPLYHSSVKGMYNGIVRVCIRSLFKSSVGFTIYTSNGSWCMGIKGEMSGTVCVTFTWDMYIYIWVVYSLCFFCCLFITVTWWYVWCIEWASGNQEEVQACLVTLWLFIISCYSLYKTTLGLLCSWFENNPHFHKYSMDSHV